MLGEYKLVDQQVLLTILMYQINILYSDEPG